MKKKKKKKKGDTRDARKKEVLQSFSSNEKKSD
jgi:hypothetical protein